MIRYFWEEKGDLERNADWENVIPILERECPQIVKAWRDYIAARAILDAVVKSLPSEE